MEVDISPHDSIRIRHKGIIKPIVTLASIENLGKVTSYVLPSNRIFYEVKDKEDQIWFYYHSTKIQHSYIRVYKQEGKDVDIKYEYSSHRHTFNASAEKEVTISFVQRREE
jgi:hypothetical protein